MSLYYDKHIVTMNRKIIILCQRKKPQRITSISSEAKEFLVKTSFLSDIKVDQAVAMTGNVNATDILQNIQQLNFFINQPDETGVTFRFHPLFRVFLQNKAEKLLSFEELLVARNIV